MCSFHVRGPRRPARSLSHMKEVSMVSVLSCDISYKATSSLKHSSYWRTTVHLTVCDDLPSD